MKWAQRLKRVFQIDIETCSECGGAMKVIACIEDPVVIKQILDHLKQKSRNQRVQPVAREPGTTGWPVAGSVYLTRPKRFRSRCCGNSAAAGMRYAGGLGWPRLSGKRGEFSAGSMATRAGFRITHWQSRPSFAVYSGWTWRKTAFILPILRHIVGKNNIPFPVFFHDAFHPIGLARAQPPQRDRHRPFLDLSLHYPSAASWLQPRPLP